MLGLAMLCYFCGGSPPGRLRENLITSAAASAGQRRRIAPLASRGRTKGQGDAPAQGGMARYETTMPKLENEIGHGGDEDGSPGGGGRKASRIGHLCGGKRDGIHVGEAGDDGHDIEAGISEVFLAEGDGQQNDRVNRAEDEGGFQFCGVFLLGQFRLLLADHDKQRSGRCRR